MAAKAVSARQTQKLCSVQDMLLTKQSLNHNKNYDDDYRNCRHCIPAANILQLRTEFFVDGVHQSFAVPAFREHGNDGVLIRKDHGILAVFSVGPVRVIFAAPEQIAVWACALLTGTLVDPCRGKKLTAVPFSLIQIEQTKSVQL